MRKLVFRRWGGGGVINTSWLHLRLLVTNLRLQLLLASSHPKHYQLWCVGLRLKMRKKRKRKRRRRRKRRKRKRRRRSQCLDVTSFSLPFLLRLLLSRTHLHQFFPPPYSPPPPAAVCCSPVDAVDATCLVSYRLKDALLQLKLRLTNSNCLV